MRASAAMIEGLWLEDRGVLLAWGTPFLELVDVGNAAVSTGPGVDRVFWRNTRVLGLEGTLCVTCSAGDWTARLNAALMDVDGWDAGDAVETLSRRLGPHEYDERHDEVWRLGRVRARLHTFRDDHEFSQDEGRVTITAGFTQVVAPSSLDVAPARLPLEHGPDGPRVMSECGWWSALAWVLNAAVDGSEPGLRETILSATSWSRAGALVKPLYAGCDVPGLGERWQRETGTTLTKPAFVFDLDFGPEIAIAPVALVQRALAELERLREALAIAPPWLFVNPVRSPLPHWSERASLEELDRRIAEDPNHPWWRSQIAVRGLCSSERIEEKRRLLDLWELPRLRALLDGACHLGTAKGGAA